MTIALAILAALGWAFAALAIHRLYRWERILRGARILIGFKRRVQMQPTLLDLLKWALVLERDKHNTGQVFYKERDHTIAIAKPLHRSHGKAKTETKAPDYQPKGNNQRAPGGRRVITLNKGAGDERKTDAVAETK